ncbi:M14 family zinc carboxypeptidase [Gemmatimonadota bacterium]
MISYRAFKLFEKRRTEMRSHAVRTLLSSMLLTAVLVSPSLGQTIPTPASVLGFEPGADFHLASFDQLYEYFQQLDRASDRLTLQEVGRSSFGNPMFVAFISSAENLRNLEHYREISLRLAHPEGLSDEEARRLANEGKAIVHVDGGMHSTEVAGHQHTILLAYTLLTGDDDPEIQAILENVIFMLWPTLNPDGMNMVSEWYMSNVGTPFETSGTPELYQKWVGHDNNRDGYMLGVPESRVITHTERYWEPQILYNHHQTAPFPTRIWIPPFAEPISPRVHPLMWRTVNLMGMAMAEALEERGQKGAVHMGTGFDNWYPGFMDHAHNFHNVASFLTETALFSYATPGYYTLRDFPEGRQDLRPESLYPSPWEGGWWHLRDAVDYMHTASMSVLDFAAKFKFDVLYNRYQAGRDIIAEYTENPPYAYFIPQAQRDPVAPVEMLRRLAFNGIEIHRLTRAVEHEGIRHPEGTWVILMQQPFANFVRQLLEIQHYPDMVSPSGQLDTPYDISGWTLPLQMDVKVYEASQPLEQDVLAALAPVEGGRTVDWRQEGAVGAAFDSPFDVGFDTDPVAAAIVPPAGAIRGSGNAVALDPAQLNTFKALNQAWAQGGTVRYAGGRYLVSGVGENTVRSWADDLALRAERTRATGTELTRPRIGLFRPWGGNIDEGWTRLLLEQYGFELKTLRNADVKAGDLKSRYDVIIFADIREGSIVEGRQEGTVPARYAGGIGEEGVRELDRFVREGGTMVCLNGNTSFAISNFGLPVQNAVSGMGSQEFFVAGSILAAEADPSHPVMAGMPTDAKLMVHRSPVFTVTEGFQGRALAKYQESGSPLLSGFLIGPEKTNGYAAALDVFHGRGHVILLGFRPQWRGQPFGLFRILFNAAVYHGAVATSVTAGGDFWSPPAGEEGEGDEPPPERTATRRMPPPGR